MTRTKAWVAALCAAGCTTAGSPAGGGPGAGGKADETDAEAASPLRFVNTHAMWNFERMTRTKPGMTVRGGIAQPATWSLEAARAAVEAADAAAGCGQRVTSDGSMEDARRVMRMVREELLLKGSEGEWVWNGLLGDPDDDGDDDAPVGAVLSAPESLEGLLDGCDGVEIVVEGRDGTLTQTVMPVRSPEATTRVFTELEGVFWPNAADVALDDRMDAYGGNGGSLVGQHPGEKLDLEALIADIRARDERYGGCEAPTRIHVGVDEVLATAGAFVKNDDIPPFDPSYSGEYTEETAAAAELDKEAFLTALADPTNLAVLSSTWPEEGDPEGDFGDHPESCLFYHFYVLRSDGTALRLTFDYTD